MRQLVLCEKDFGWMVLWELNPEVFGLRWLMASATWGGGGSLRRKASMIGKAGMPVLNYTLTFALQLRRNTETLSQGS
jgi:hypothetical protein